MEIILSQILFKKIKREKEAKKQAKESLDLFTFAKRKSIAGGYELPPHALYSPDQSSSSSSSSSSLGKGSHKHKQSSGSKQVTLPSSLQLPVLNSLQLEELLPSQREVYWLGQRAVSLTRKQYAAERSVKVSRAIFDEMQRASWHLTSHFVDGHIKEKMMLMLTGVGDPSGCG
jgi:hypothetical protein